ncbi:MAG: ABC transporter permease subunit [Bacteroidetes bacterium]|jgi:ABC-type dipeptide/oligopeptide/nickel transport system permease subunit|nr:ABC transporter permease subunit [Bacteroidota bacterium]
MNPDFHNIRKYFLGLLFLPGMTLIILSFFAVETLSIVLDEARNIQLWSQSSWQHPLGTDGYGFDVYRFLLLAIKTDIQLFAIPILIFFLVGTTLGVGLSYMRGYANKIFDMLFNLLNSFPLVLLLLLLLIIVEGFFAGKDTFSKLFLLFNVYAVVSSSKLAIELRGKIESTNKKDFIESSKALGLSPLAILIKHILYYNCRKTIVASTLHFISQLIFIEITLAYLNLGASGNVLTLGNMFTKYFPYINAFTTLDQWQVAVPSMLTIYLILILTLSTRNMLRHE